MLWYATLNYVCHQSNISGKCQNSIIVNRLRLTESHISLHPSRALDCSNRIFRELEKTTSSMLWSRNTSSWFWFAVSHSTVVLRVSEFLWIPEYRIIGLRVDFFFHLFPTISTSVSVLNWWNCYFFNSLIENWLNFSRLYNCKNTFLLNSNGVIPMSHAFHSDNRDSWKML